jgi:hypothetical protein
VHRKAVEQAKQWLDSLEGASSGTQQCVLQADEDRPRTFPLYIHVVCRFLNEWQQHHAHSFSDGKLKARWLSINTDTTAKSSIQKSANMPYWCASLSPENGTTSSPFSYTKIVPGERVLTQALPNNFPGFQKDVGKYPVCSYSLGPPIRDFGKAALPSKESGLSCRIGLLPMCDGMHVDDGGMPFNVSVPQLTFSVSNCEIAHGTWRNYLVLLSEDASFLESENMWPNFMSHKGRTLHNITCAHAVRFLADPCVSEVGSCCAQ